MDQPQTSQHIISILCQNSLLLFEEYFASPTKPEKLHLPPSKLRELEIQPPLRESQ
jgi:hypothetical protein